MRTLPYLQLYRYSRHRRMSTIDILDRDTFYTNLTKPQLLQNFHAPDKPFLRSGTFVKALPPLFGPVDVTAGLLY